MTNEKDIYKADLTNASKENIFYSLAMFPYPSGAGLHVGHGMNFTANDIVARFKRMQGYTVINPMGWDSFGLPTENYAMKLGKPAGEVTTENIANYKKQCELMDRSYDWDREVTTSSPEYYKRTQWIFVQLYKAGLVYKKDAYVNRCPSCQTVLANDQVVEGKCERCSTEALQKKHPQWFIKITDYAEKLIDGLDSIDWPEETKIQQKYWIGKSIGAEIDFQVEQTLLNKVDPSSETIFIMHGMKRRTAAKIDGWQGRLKDVFEKKGYNVVAPFLENSATAFANDRLQAVNSYKDNIGENTTLVGHSTGAATLIRWLGENPSIIVKKIILVAPGKIPASEGEKTISSQTREPLSNEDYSGMKDLYDFEIDKTIHNRVREGIYVLTSNDEQRLLESAQAYVEALGAKSLVFEGREHFQSSLGEINQTFEELIPLINGNNTEKITVFTTRPDTLFGVTAIVLAPENASIDAYIPAEYKKELDKYRFATGKKTAIERQQDVETKSGVFSGVYAIHPLTGEKVPVWFADYVLPDYATGAVMFVPAHDERDFAFAKKHDLPIKQVILGKEIDKEKLEKLFALHQELQNNAEKLGVDVYCAGGLSIPLRTGVVYRNHGDLDYVLKTGSAEVLLQKFLDEKRITETKQKEHGIVEYTIDGIEVEFLPTDNDSMWIPLKDESYDQHIFQLRNNIGKTYTSEFINTIKKVRNASKDQLDLQYLAQGAYTDAGVLINSGKFDGLDNTDAKQAIITELENQGVGRAKITYKLRDWSVSRQRYWGSPIPVYYTFADPHYDAHNPDPDKSKWIPHLIPEDELPVILPLDLGNYKPAGKSPLADHPTFPYYKAKDGNIYLRECDTLDTFMCSSFYFLRFVDPQNENELISKELAAKALPVDFYIGGKEHTYGHLLYSRFINRFLFDQGYIPNPEPFQKLFHQGMVLGPDGRKMSKRWGNVITPGDLVEKYGQERGSDVLRTYTMFMGPLELEKAWNDGAVDGVKRFLDRVERMQDFLSDTEDPKTTIQLHKTIKGVTDDIGKLKFNTAVSKLMIFVNHVYDMKQITKGQFLLFLHLLAPFATKITQELREKLGESNNIHLSKRPSYDETLLADDMFSLPVQINGKMRGNVEVPVGISQDEVVNLITTHEKFIHHFESATIKKIIYVQDKIVNFIIVN